jgi:hypothetical protein
VAADRRIPAEPLLQQRTGPSDIGNSEARRAPAAGGAAEGSERARGAASQQRAKAPGAVTVVRRRSGVGAGMRSLG